MVNTQKRRAARSLRDKPPLRAALAVARQTPDIFSSVRAVVNRKQELMDPDDPGREYAPLLAAIAMSRRGRALFELAIDRAVARDSQFFRKLLRTRVARKTAYKFAEEVVIGSGLHAAIYASVRADKGASPPLIVERRNRVGGVFALARRPVFYLNSRNRVESAGTRRRPGTPGPLNSVVGGALQPSDISGQEYQPQSDLAYATRVNLALYGRAVTNVEVIKVFVQGAQYLVVLRSLVYPPRTFRVLTNRIIVASGVGEPTSDVSGLPHPRVMNFEQFIERVGDTGNPFPLRGFGKVAVVGANDSGNVVVEYLLGQGPEGGASVAGLDYVQKIVWIGQQSRTKEQFEACNRSRYQGIGRAMPRGSDGQYYYRVQPVPGRALTVDDAPQGVRLFWKKPDGTRQSDTFDYVILATGYKSRIDNLFARLVPDDSPLTEPVEINGEVVAKRYTGTEIYKVGPAADLQVTEDERRDIPVLAQIPANSVAVFRYGERTATLARHLSANTEPCITDRELPVLPAALLPTTNLVVPIAPNPLPLPEDIVSEDVVRCVVYESLNNLGLDEAVRITVRKRPDGNYGFAINPRIEGLIGLARVTAQMLRDPSMQAVLTQYVTDKHEAVIDVPFHDGRLELAGVHCMSRRTR